jgi:hypothetical protein
MALPPSATTIGAAKSFMEPLSSGGTRRESEDPMFPDLQVR